MTRAVKMDPSGRFILGQAFLWNVWLYVSSKKEPGLMALYVESLHLAINEDRVFTMEGRHHDRRRNNTST